MRYDLPFSRKIGFSTKTDKLVMRIYLRFISPFAYLIFSQKETKKSKMQVATRAPF